MSRYEKVRQRINEIIKHNMEKLDDEIECYEQKMHDTESFYGFGGAYSRQERARDKRIAEKEALEQLLKGVGEFQKTHNVKFYYMNCNECGAILLTTRAIPRGYHECPCCGKCVYTDSSYKTNLELLDNGKAILDSLRNATKGE